MSCGCFGFGGMLVFFDILILVLCFGTRDDLLRGRRKGFY